MLTTILTQQPHDCQFLTETVAERASRVVGSVGKELKREVGRGRARGLYTARKWRQARACALLDGAGAKPGGNTTTEMIGWLRSRSTVPLCEPPHPLQNSQFIRYTRYCSDGFHRLLPTSISDRSKLQQQTCLSMVVGFRGPL
jgi:hypothetical protein